VLKHLSSLFSPQFIKFCVVGGLGLVTDQTVFFLLSTIVDPASVLVNFVWVVGYLLAVVQNYLINHYWTFKAQTSESRPSGRGLVVFLLVSLTSLIPRFIAYKGVLVLFGVSQITMNLANLCGIVAGTVVNFFGSKFIVFAKKA